MSDDVLLNNCKPLCLHYTTHVSNSPAPYINLNCTTSMHAASSTMRVRCTYNLQYLRAMVITTLCRRNATPALRTRDLRAFQ